MQPSHPILALTNDVLQAAIVIFGSAVVLYNLRHFLRDRVTRAFSNLVLYVVIVYLTELMASRTNITASPEPWLRLEWVGIAMVPAAQYHLSDALLAVTGHSSRRRRLMVRVFYLTGVAFIGLVALSNLIVGGLIDLPAAAHLMPGPLFPVFALYFWAVTVASIYNVWRAHQLSVTSSTRQRMLMILAAVVAAPVGVFPYLLISSNPNIQLTAAFWLVLIVGNITVGLMFAFLTYYLAYFGAGSPDRVVRVRLFKFMARVPMTATFVLLAYVLVGRTSSLLGLPPETAQAIAVVATVMIVEWAIHAFKRPLERLFHLNNEPDVRRIQRLSDRLLTTRDLHQFLESVLITLCETLRIPTAFVAAFTPEGPKLEVVVDPQDELKDIQGESWRELTQPAGGNGDNEHLETSGEFVLWRNYWIRTLHNRQGDALVGILGIQARAEKPNLSEAEQAAFDRLALQAARALEDRILQQEVFAAVEGLLPQITALQRQRSAAKYDATTLLTAPVDEDEVLINDPDFSTLVKDALSHYWGGPKLTESPLMRLHVVQDALAENKGNATKAMRSILERAIEQQKPEGRRSMTTAEWILYNILELKFIQGQKVRDVARRLAMSESDLYRKQRVAIENVASAIQNMERQAVMAQRPAVSQILSEEEGDNAGEGAAEDGEGDEAVIGEPEHEA
ncbi:MAG: hypothetical protein R3248_04760 [Candidatus Promineifilaceae bacterium]|nr:hypothetical protein [Candidatus Promineifilaceae bacterium]